MRLVVSIGTTTLLKKNMYNIYCCHVSTILGFLNKKFVTGNCILQPMFLISISTATGKKNITVRIVMSKTEKASILMLWKQANFCEQAIGMSEF